MWLLKRVRDNIVVRTKLTLNFCLKGVHHIKKKSVIILLTLTTFISFLRYWQMSVFFPLTTVYSYTANHREKCCPLLVLGIIVALFMNFNIYLKHLYVNIYTKQCSKQKLSKKIHIFLCCSFVYLIYFQLKIDLENIGYPARTCLGTCVEFLMQFMWHTEQNHISSFKKLKKIQSTKHI